jgi:hypothetical protein
MASSQTQQWIDEAARLRRDFLDPIEQEQREREARWFDCICVPNGVECADDCQCRGHYL